MLYSSRGRRARAIAKTPPINIPAEGSGTAMVKQFG
jgi:hypothetical protein